jgi:hypothetical protein
LPNERNTQARAVEIEVIKSIVSIRLVAPSAPQGVFFSRTGRLFRSPMIPGAERLWSAADFLQVVCQSC